ncbi:MAG: hypothetical protein KGL25_12615 [Gammaproteobacteria bacterium]|nr:hypothetical protein [Gammaproteobacteria bacterium]MDE2252234.1 hypothetical protein [Gammaproteobacteria bacterium]
MNASPAPPARNRRPVLLLFVLFAAPLAGAFWLYYGSSWRPALRTNHGELITPVTLPELALPLAVGAAGAPGKPAAAPAKLLRGKWSLLVIGHGEAGCDATCRNALVYARQTWLSLAQLAPRAQRVLLAGAGCCDLEYLRREHPGLIALDASGSTAEALMRLFPAAREGAIFIVDPLGNLMMRYDVRQDPKGLREDLKKLLELSHIG